MYMYKEMWIIMIIITYLGNMSEKAQTGMSTYPGPVLSIY